MLTQSDTKYWGPHPEVVAYVGSLVAAGARVLELGPGKVPFFKSTQFVDGYPGENTVVCNSQRDNLPFPDKSFDFVYSRHVMEDFPLPFKSMDEMSRVAKAGYIETPSPVAELCRGIDGGSPAWRGYIHHSWVAYDDGGVLTFIRKWPIIELAQFSDENFFANVLRANRFAWNTYYPWEGEIRWQIQEFNNLSVEYSSILAGAANKSLQATQKFVARMASSG